MSSVPQLENHVAGRRASAPRPCASVCSNLLGAPTRPEPRKAGRDPAGGGDGVAGAVLQGRTRDRPFGYWEAVREPDHGLVGPLRLCGGRRQVNAYRPRPEGTGRSHLRRRSHRERSAIPVTPKVTHYLQDKGALDAGETMNAVAVPHRASPCRRHIWRRCGNQWTERRVARRLRCVRLREPQVDVGSDVAGTRSHAHGLPEWAADLWHRHQSLQRRRSGSK